MFQLQLVHVPSLPSLSWCAHINKKSNIIILFYGSGVETQSDSFVEGAWDGHFIDFDFINTSVMSGTGGKLSDRAISFIGSTDRLSPLISIDTKSTLYISNSIFLIMANADEEPNPIYPYYPYDAIKIWRHGHHMPQNSLPLSSGNQLRIHFGVTITIQKDHIIHTKPHNPGELPKNYLHYKSILDSKIKSVFKNAQAVERKTIYTPLSALSQGYDSTATSVLARDHGCEEVISFSDSRRTDPYIDCGKKNAERLGMKYNQIDRWDFLKCSSETIAELSFLAISACTPMAGFEELLKNKIFISGHRGDLLWSLNKMPSHNQLGHTWAKFISGFNMLEFRLRVGFFLLPPATILEQHNHAIHQISHSETMKPWLIKGDYNRPIARRIIEEGGIPRGQFATKKMGSGHYTFKYKAAKVDLPLKTRENYEAFIAEIHSSVSSLKSRFWKMRVNIDHFIWHKISNNKKRITPSTYLQRKLPYILNVAPTKLKWQSMFTLQWSYHMLKQRYQVPTIVAPESIKVK